MFTAAKVGRFSHIHNRTIGVFLLPHVWQGDTYIVVEKGHLSSGVGRLQGNFLP